jgi:cyanophycin synthetase
MNLTLLPSRAESSRIDFARRLIEGQVGLGFDFRLPEGTDPAHLDRWIESLACAEATALEAQSAGASWGVQPAPEPLASRYLVRVLRLALVLMQAARVPVFDDPVIESLLPASTRPGWWRAQVAFSRVDGIASDAWSLALAGAIEACAWLPGRSFDETDRDQFFAMAQQRVDRLAAFAPGGRSTMPVLRAAHALGIPFIHLGLGVFQLGWGSRARRMDRSATDRDPAIAARLARNKIAGAALLRQAGLPAPQHEAAGDAQSAWAIAQRLGLPVVVKPVDRDRGEGVSVGIIDEAALRRAFDAARAVSANGQILVERQVDGVCHRVFVAAGRVLFVEKRLPISVVGDGVRTVGQLVADELDVQRRRAPWARSRLLPIDPPAIETMARAGWSESSIPPAGVRVALRQVESTESGGVDEDVTELIHPENAALAIRAADLFGLEMAGIDLICDDIGRPWFDTGAVINEVNFAPLLGADATSRNRLPELLRSLVPNGGRIPVEVFDAHELPALRARLEEWLGRGIRCFTASASTSTDPSGKTLHLACQGLENRIRALVCRPDVDAVLAICLPQAGPLPGGKEPPASESWHGSHGLLEQAGQLWRSGRFDESLGLVDRAIDSAPDRAATHSLRGSLLEDLQRIDEAIAAYDRALAIEPGLAEARMRKAHALLMKGDYATGWPLYEARWQTTARRRDPRPPADALWTGEQPLAGRSLLIHPEVGFGDYLMFARFVPLLQGRGAQVRLLVRSPLLELLRASFPQAAVYDGLEGLPRSDLHCPLLSLPRALGLTLEQVSTSFPYLAVPPVRVTQWRDRLGSGDLPRIGLAWSGRQDRDIERNPLRRRSIRLADLQPLLDLPFEFHALQKDCSDSDRALAEGHPQLVTHFESITDFADVAAIALQMDQVITIDTAVAHLSAALGRPTTVMLPFATDYRWRHEGDSTPWYPQATLLRQRVPADWSGVIQRLVARLGESADDECRQAAVLARQGR